MGRSAYGPLVAARETGVVLARHLRQASDGKWGEPDFCSYLLSLLPTEPYVQYPSGTIISVGSKDRPCPHRRRPT